MVKGAEEEPEESKGDPKEEPMEEVDPVENVPQIGPEDWEMEPEEEMELEVAE